MALVFFLFEFPVADVTFAAASAAVAEAAASGTAAVVKEELRS